MEASMKQERCYSSGTFVCRDLFAYVGWTCHKGAFADCMPIHNETEDVTIVLTGEMYDEPKTIETLRAGNHSFAPHDASYLVHLYEEQGDDFFHRLNGLYAGLLVDRRHSKLFLFNDRYGVKRLFISQGKDSFYFASRAKALLAVLPETREFDPSGLAEYLTCGCTLGRKSLYRNIDILPASSLWSFENGAVAKKSIYFDRAEWDQQERLDASQFTDHVRTLFPAVVNRYSKARLPVGISLTGGLDSRMLVACLDMEPGTLPCYTFGSMYRETFDVQIAREIAKQCEQSHEVIVLGTEFLRDFPGYLEKAVCRSDGYLGLAGAAELYVNSLAARIAPIRLTGNFGSELLRGVRAFKARSFRASLLTPDLQTWLEEAQHTFLGYENTDPVTFAIFHQAPDQGYGRLAVEESQVIMRTPFLDNLLVKSVYQRPAEPFDGTRLSASIIEEYAPRLAGIPTDRGELGNVSPWKRPVRRFYSEALFKCEYWASHGMPQWLAKLTRCIPWLSPEQRYLGRHKFQHYRLWLRRELSGCMQDVLRPDGRLPDFVDKQQLASIVNAHLNGRGNYIDEIDKMMTITLGARLLFHQNP